MAALMPLVVFILVMWGLMMAGGGILVLLVAPMDIDCCGEQRHLASSVAKALVTLGLIILWIFILSWMKRAILHRALGRR